MVPISDGNANKRTSVSGGPDRGGFLFQRLNTPPSQVTSTPSTLDPGPWTMDPGPWTLDPGPWTLDLKP